MDSTQKKSLVIAIDGPSGSGKSSIAKNLAMQLGLIYIDTGAMFRAIAFYFDSQKIPMKEGPHLKESLASLKIGYGLSQSKLIEINGVDLTLKIREHHVSKLASTVSQLPTVRDYLLNFQRSLAKDRLCVMEGRDIGTIVFPNALIKFFITASIEIRAERRFLELKTSGDQTLTLDKIIDDVKKRDITDMNRDVAPLKRAEDALLYDTTHLTLDEITKNLIEKVKASLAHENIN